MRSTLVYVILCLLATPIFSIPIQAKDRTEIGRGIGTVHCILPKYAAHQDSYLGSGFLLGFEDRPWLVSSQYFLSRCTELQGVGLVFRYRDKTYKITRILSQDYWRIFLGEVEGGCNIPQEQWLEIDPTAMNVGDSVERSIPNRSAMFFADSSTTLMDAMPYYASLQLRTNISDGSNLPYIYVTEVPRPWDDNSQLGAPVFSAGGEKVVGMQIRPFEGGPGNDYHLLIMPIHHLASWLKEHADDPQKFALQTFSKWSADYFTPKQLQKGHDIPSYERVQYGYSWLHGETNSKNKDAMEAAANFLYKALNGVRFMAYPKSIDQGVFLEEAILALVTYYATEGDFEGCMNTMQLATDLGLPGRVQHQMIRIQRAYSNF